MTSDVEPLDPALERTFDRDVQEVMSFLGKSGFNELPMQRGMASLCKSFVGRNVALEFIVDVREEVYESKVAKVTNGQPAADFAVAKDGSLVRAHLRAMLRLRGLTPGEIRKTGNLPFAQYVRATLEEDARLLRLFGNDILADRPDVFQDAAL